MLTPICFRGIQGVPLYQHFADLAGVKAPFILPCPCFNVINGGSHAGNSLAFQEFMILPVGAKDFNEAMQMGTETYHGTLAFRIFRLVGPRARFCGERALTVSRPFSLRDPQSSRASSRRSTALTPPTSEMREDSPPTSAVPTSPSTSSRPPSRRPVTLARSRSLCTPLSLPDLLPILLSDLDSSLLVTSPRLSSTRRASTTLSKLFSPLACARAAGRS